MRGGDARCCDCVVPCVDLSFSFFLIISLPHHTLIFVRRQADASVEERSNTRNGTSVSMRACMHAGRIYLSTEAAEFDFAIEMRGLVFLELSLGRLHPEPVFDRKRRQAREHETSCILSRARMPRRMNGRMPGLSHDLPRQNRKHALPGGHSRQVFNQKP